MTDYEYEKTMNFFLALTDEQVEIAKKAIEIRRNKNSCYGEMFDDTPSCLNCPMAIDCAAKTIKLIKWGGE